MPENNRMHLPDEYYFITMKDVCRLTTFSPQHVYRLERQGRFVKRIRMGANRICYRYSEVKAWLDARQIVDPANDNKPIPNSPAAKKLGPKKS